MSLSEFFVAVLVCAAVVATVTVGLLSYAGLIHP
jgi:hypothetical protein